MNFTESGRWNANIKDPMMLRCCVTDGTSENLSAKCVVLYRLNSSVDLESKQFVEVSPKIIQHFGNQINTWKN